MNYLDLCKRLAQESGISGAGPATTVSQTGQLKRVVDWTSQAWQDIQKMRTDWLFMSKEFTFNTVAATRDYYAPDYSITNVDRWDNQSFLIYETALGESDQNKLEFLSYRKWRDAYRVRMNSRPNARPQQFTFMPENNAIRFESRPPHNAASSSPESPALLPAG